jgi:hypothetical protein
MTVVAVACLFCKRTPLERYPARHHGRELRRLHGQAFYAGFGFVETGIDEAGEMVAELRVA